MSEAIAKYMLNNWKRLVISFDECSESPRNFDEDSFLCMRKHRNYDFPNELEYDFNDLDDGWMDWVEMSKILKENYVFWIDCYEHSWIVFSLSWEWMQCKFDTSKYCGFMAVKKELYKTEEEAKKRAKEQLSIYNKRISWEVYEYLIEKSVEWKTDDWRTKIEWEPDYYSDDSIYSCWWYYDIKYILEEFKDLEPKEI